MPGSETNTRLVAAIDYAKRGWSVIPVEPRGKRPLVAWRRYQSETASIATVSAWFDRWPQANVAIVTGRLSGLVVLDVDARHDGPGSLAELVRDNGPIAATVEAITGGGGRHLYFRHPGPATPNRVGLRPGVDIRGDGGCVVAPPSIHISGRSYAWASSRAPGDVPIAPLPRWLAPGPRRGPAKRSRRRTG